MRKNQCFCACITQETNTLVEQLSASELPALNCSLHSCVFLSKMKNFEKSFIKCSCSIGVARKINECRSCVSSFGLLLSLSLFLSFWLLPQLFLSLSLARLLSPQCWALLIDNSPSHTLTCFLLSSPSQRNTGRHTLSLHLTLTRTHTSCRSPLHRQCVD